MIDPFELPAAANVIEEPLKTFKCIKCGEDSEYSEFFKHDDPTFDYGFYLLDGCIVAQGVEIVKGVDLCAWCVPNMYLNEEKNNDEG